MTLKELYGVADGANIAVDHFKLNKREALSVMDGEGRCHIALDPVQLKSEADERAKLAHELGHCMTGAFYNVYTDLDNRQRHENTADKWAVRQLVAESALDDAVAQGHTTLWDLADHFGIPEPMMRKAVCYYTYGNVAAELYF